MNTMTSERQYMFQTDDTKEIPVNELSLTNFLSHNSVMHLLNFYLSHNSQLCSRESFLRGLGEGEP